MTRPSAKLAASTRSQIHETSRVRPDAAAMAPPDPHLRGHRNPVGQEILRAKRLQPRSRPNRPRRLLELPSREPPNLMRPNPGRSSSMRATARNPSQLDKPGLSRPFNGRSSSGQPRPPRHRPARPPPRSPTRCLRRLRPLRPTHLRPPCPSRPSRPRRLPRSLQSRHRKPPRSLPSPSQRLNLRPRLHPE